MGDAGEASNHEKVEMIEGRCVKADAHIVRAHEGRRRHVGDVHAIERAISLNHGGAHGAAQVNDDPLPEHLRQAWRRLRAARHGR